MTRNPATPGMTRNPHCTVIAGLTRNPHCTVIAGLTRNPA